MYQIFGVIVLLAPFIVLLGMINPRLALPRRWAPTRGKVLRVYALVLVAAFILFGLTIPNQSSTPLETRHQEPIPVPPAPAADTAPALPIASPQPPPQEAAPQASTEPPAAHQLANPTPALNSEPPQPVTPPPVDPLEALRSKIGSSSGVKEVTIYPQVTGGRSIHIVLTLGSGFTFSGEMDSTAFYMKNAAFLVIESGLIDRDIFFFVDAPLQGGIQARVFKVQYKTEDLKSYGEKLKYIRGVDFWGLAENISTTHASAVELVEYCADRAIRLRIPKLCNRYKVP